MPSAPNASLEHCQLLFYAYVRRREPLFPPPPSRSPSVKPSASSFSSSTSSLFFPFLPFRTILPLCRVLPDALPALRSPASSTFHQPSKPSDNVASVISQHRRGLYLCQSWQRRYIRPRYRASGSAMPLRSLLDFLTVTILARALSAPAFVPRSNSIDSTSYDKHVVRIHDDARVISFDRRATTRHIICIRRIGSRGLLDVSIRSISRRVDR